MIELTPDRLEKATAKAKQCKPLVKVLEFRRYQVTNRETGASYEVTFTKLTTKNLVNVRAKQVSKASMPAIILFRH